MKALGRVDVSYSPLLEVIFLIQQSRRSVVWLFQMSD